MRMVAPGGPDGPLLPLNAESWNTNPRCHGCHVVPRSSSPLPRRNVSAPFSLRTTTHDQAPRLDDNAGASAGTTKSTQFHNPCLAAEEKELK